MKKIFLLFVLLLSGSHLSFAQKDAVKPGSVKYLDFKNGFKDIKLGSNINDVKDRLKLESTNSDSTTVFTYKLNGDTLVSGVRVTNVFVTAFKNKVMSINVSLDKDWAHKLWEVFYEAYGTMTSRPNQFMNKFIWTGKNVELLFDFESRQPTADFTELNIFKEYLKFSKLKSQNAVKEL